MDQGKVKQLKKIVVLGGSGMLGIGVMAALRDFGVTDFAYSTRTGESASGFESFEHFSFDANDGDFHDLIDLARDGYVINCIGVIKPHIKDDNASQRRNAILINGMFPDALDRAAQDGGFKVIQIATDCVYSGNKGSYLETDAFDATDVYGKTKSLGEIPSENFMHLRVSIIGPESGRSTSLFEWVRNQPADSQINGFTDHEWNGVTTYHFGKICYGIISQDLFRAGTFHVVPGSRLSKYELVSALAKRAGRGDINITPKPSGAVIDRTLETVNPDFNLRLWNAAGYSSIPTVQQMVEEMPL